MREAGARGTYTRRAALLHGVAACGSAVLCVNLEIGAEGGALQRACVDCGLGGLI